MDTTTQRDLRAYPVMEAADPRQQDAWDTQPGPGFTAADHDFLQSLPPVEPCRPQG